MFLPIIIERKNLSFLFAAFMLIAFLSMFNEDCLETQAGVTFYAFFAALFMWAYKNPTKR